MDFVLVGYGMAEGPLAEDAGEVRRSLIDRGYGADVVAQANEITDATARVIASDYQDGFDELAAAKAKYRDELWFGPGPYGRASIAQPALRPIRTADPSTW